MSDPATNLAPMMLAPSGVAVPVPRAMSTQHPDNAGAAAFAGEAVLKGEGEIAEALHVFSVLGCDEQMWDYEGKAADVDVVLKLLVRSPEYFTEHVLGERVFLTLRIPNPTVEQEMRKKVEEALHNIVTSYDVATRFYGRPVAPVFQVILPFTTSAEELARVDAYYREVVVGMQRHPLPGGLRVEEWLGAYRPEAIQVIPLVEDMPRLVAIDGLVERYLELLNRPVDALRVFLARSDPALNYGVVSAALLAKLALQRLHGLERRLGVPIYPIIGVGGVPFRGNFRPGRVARMLESYPSVQTFTVQSSFKYDYPHAEVAAGMAELAAHRRSAPLPIDEERALDLVRRFTRRYQEQVGGLATLVNTAAGYIPQRRDRRLHNGLFGYSRSSGDDGEGVHLPRAITFCAALYSLGIPPELLGLDALTPADMRFLEGAMPNYTNDLTDALRFANPANIEAALGRSGLEALYRFMRDVDLEHRGITTLVQERIRGGIDSEQTRTLVEWAAQTRGFLG